MLLPFSRMVSSFVTRRPSGVLSLRRGRAASARATRRGRAALGLGCAAPPGRGRAGAATWHALLGDILEDHVDVHVEAAQRAHQLLLPLHNHLSGGGAPQRTGVTALRRHARGTGRRRTPRAAERGAAQRRQRKARQSAQDGGEARLGRARTQMRLPTHLSTSSLGSRCDRLPPCCLVGSAIGAEGRDAGRRRGAPALAASCHVARGSSDALRSREEQAQRDARRSGR